MWAVLSTPTRESATARAVIGEHAEWSLDTHLLALIADELAIANWQRGGGKGRRPKPIPRPGGAGDAETIHLDRFASPAAFDEWREAQLNN